MSFFLTLLPLNYSKYCKTSSILYRYLLIAYLKNVFFFLLFQPGKKSVFKFSFILYWLESTISFFLIQPFNIWPLNYWNSNKHTHMLHSTWLTSSLTALCLFHSTWSGVFFFFLVFFYSSLHDRVFFLFLSPFPHISFELNKGSKYDHWPYSMVKTLARCTLCSLVEIDRRNEFFWIKLKYLTLSHFTPVIWKCIGFFFKFVSDTFFSILTAFSIVFLPFYCCFFVVQSIQIHNVFSFVPLASCIRKEWDQE